MNVRSAFAFCAFMVVVLFLATRKFPNTLPQQQTSPKR